MSWKEAQKQEQSRVEAEEFARIMRAKRDADEAEREQVCGRHSRHEWQMRETRCWALMQRSPADCGMLPEAMLWRRAAGN